jgi:hypothetical protein
MDKHGCAAQVGVKIIWKCGTGGQARFRNWKQAQLKQIGNIGAPLHGILPAQPWMMYFKAG